MVAFDLLRLDRSLAELAKRQRRFSAALKSSDALEHSFEDLPSGIDRELLSEVTRAAAENPLAQAAQRWLEFLLVEHAALEETRAVARELYRVQHPVQSPEPGRVSIAQLREQVLTDGVRREQWLSALGSCCGSLRARRFALWERKAERGAALAASGSTSSAHAGSSEHAGAIEKLALELLAGTKDAYAELRVRSLADLIALALGHDVPGQWPNKAHPRAIADLVGEPAWLRGLTPEPFEMDRVLGTASILRAMGAFGRVLHDAGANPRAPFVLRHDPQGLRRSAYGSLFALLPFNPSFAERRLDIARSRSRDYLRSLGRVVVIAARQSAFRALLRATTPFSARAYHERFVELGALAFGFEPSLELTGALFADPRGVVNFAGLLLASQRAHELTETYDIDWFRNPRAIEHIRADFEAPLELIADPASLQLGLRALVASVQTV